MSYSEETFKEHIRHVIHAQERDAERPLTLDELRELALSMGLTASEWEQLLIKAEKALNQAVAHLKVQNYADAIQSAEEATSINPYIKDGNAILAQSYLQLALVDHNSELFVKAESHARMELRNDPLDGTALNVLSAVEAQKQDGRTSKRTIRMVATIGGAVLLVFLILFTCNRSSDSSPENQAPTPSEQRTTPENEINQLNREAATHYATYKNAIERRNQLGTELLGAIQSDRLKQALQQALDGYDFDKIRDSERAFNLAWGEAKAAGYFREEDLVRMEGSANRIATEKKRYLEKVSQYNTLLDQHPELDQQFNPIDDHE